MEKNLKPKAGSKLSYEELENVASQLSQQADKLVQQNKELQQKLNEVNSYNFFTRLEWLYKVIKDDVIYLSDECKQKCAEEFESLLNAGATGTKTEDTEDKE